jgi:hypothetical protein
LLYLNGGGIASFIITFAVVANVVLQGLVLYPRYHVRTLTAIVKYTKQHAVIATLTLNAQPETEYLNGGGIATFIFTLAVVADVVLKGLPSIFLHSRHNICAFAETA